jgi:hypothetical protein
MQLGMLCNLLATKPKFLFIMLPETFRIQWIMLVSAGVKDEPPQKTSSKI